MSGYFPAMPYLVRRAKTKLQLLDRWPDAEVGDIAHFHAASSDHHPVTTFRMLYDDAGVYVAFDVRDRYVLCRRTEHQQMVCRDSCVEAFLQPKPGRGYFNFEANCGGAMLLWYITDTTHVPGVGFKGFEKVSPALMARIEIATSLPARTAFEERDEAIEWRVAYFVPSEVFEHYVGRLEPPASRRWRGNFYKCADESSHRHWASWRPIGEKLDFHVPEFFGEIRFEG
jgi:hypothetical protein